MALGLSTKMHGPGARVLMASHVGTAIEFYDFYVYSTAASLFFGALFFPAASPSAQLLSSYGIFGLAFVARPIGSIVFGHFGDRIGRKSTLVASLLTMGLSTMAIGLVPTYAALGWLAPLLLCILRFGQGFGLGGEWGGAALLAVENAPPGYRARYAMVPQLGAPVGFIAANSLFLILGFVLTPSQFASWGWRLPFLASAALVGVGLWVRLRLGETPAFARAMEEAPPAAVPLAEVLRDHWREVLSGICAVLALFALFYLSTAFALGYGVGTLHYDRRLFLGVQMAAILFMAVGITASGLWADRTNPRRVLIAGSVGTIGVAALLAPMLGSGSLLVVFLFLSLSLLVMGFAYGPIGAWMTGLFPARVRYTGVSLAFNVGGIFGGGVAPLVAQALADHGGLRFVGLYLGTAAALSLCSLLAMPYRPHPEDVELPSPPVPEPAALM